MGSDIVEFTDEDNDTVRYELWTHGTQRLIKLSVKFDGRNDFEVQTTAVPKFKYSAWNRNLDDWMGDVILPESMAESIVKRLVLLGERANPLVPVEIPDRRRTCADRCSGCMTV